MAAMAILVGPEGPDKDLVREYFRKAAKLATVWERRSRGKHEADGSDRSRDKRT